MIAPALDDIPVAPHRADLGIGLIGAGGIAEIGHIPAYQKAGYRVVAVADPIEARRQFGQRVLGLDENNLHQDHRALLDRKDVDIVDITIAHGSPAKIPVIHEAIEAGKHILVEKPLAMDYATAKEVVAHAQRAGVKMAICHQYRWMPVYRAIKNLIDQGYLGDLFFLTMDERWHYDLAVSYDQQARVLLIIETIHFIDVFRWWTGREPQRVFASLSRRPGQYVKGEMIGTMVLEFEENLRVSYVGNMAAHPQSQQLRLRIEGTGGIVKAQHDNLWDPGSIAYSPTDEAAMWYRPKLAGDGFIDGFIGLMGDLMDAIDQDREPAVSGQDNLKTLQVVFAAYQSAELGRMVSPSEIDPDG